MLETSEQKREHALVVSVSGKLDIVSAKTLLDQLTACIDGGERRLVLDLSRLEYISSSGLRTILLVAKRLAELDGKLALAALSAPVFRIFDVAGLTSVLSIYESAQGAWEATRP